jgi:hypothetical protein
LSRHSKLKKVIGYRWDWRQVLRAEIEQATLVLKGKALWRCLRAADMATFDFGKRRKSCDSHGNPREVGEWALHIQCPWRITRDDRILVGNQDLYYPADYQYGGESSVGFDWERDSTLRDKLLHSLLQDGAQELVVDRVEVYEAGGLHIVFGEGFSMDVLPCDSVSDEHWRLFEPDKDAPHFVVTGRGIET